VAGHIVEARAEGAVETEADVLNLLDRIGAPEEIAADARERFGVRPRGGGMREIAAIVLLLVGGFMFVVGWFVGLVLLWASEAWSTRDKLIGTFVVPFGLLPLLWFLFSQTLVAGETCVGIRSSTGTVTESCQSAGTSTESTVVALLVFAFLALGPFFTTIYLARRMRKPALTATAVPTTAS